MNPPLDVEWLRRNRSEPDPLTGFDQSIDVCTTDGESVWGGIGFYADEDAPDTAGVPGTRPRSTVRVAGPYCARVKESNKIIG